MWLDTYAGVVASANTLGWERLTALDDEPLRRLIRPIGLASARVRYLSSLVRFIDRVGLTCGFARVPHGIASEVAGHSKVVCIRGGLHPNPNACSPVQHTSLVRASISAGEFAVRSR